MLYIDYRIIQSLLPRIGKKSLETFVYQECGTSGEALTDVEKAYYIQQLQQSGTLLKEIESLNMSTVLDMESALIPVLAHMESRGVAFDIKKLEHIGSKIRADISNIEAQIYNMIDDRINLNSPKQLQGLFFDTLGIKPIKKNKTGYSVDNDVLEEIAKTHDIARLVLEYRGLAKLSSTYVDGLLRAVDTNTGRIHTTYDSVGTLTGRMSSNDPNLQNIPTGDGYPNDIKSCFVPSKDRVLLVADYSQIELRILAFFSQDIGLLDAFKNNEDIHARTAQFLFGENTTITSHERRIAKTVNFGVIYGITGFGLSKTLGVGPWEANKYIDAFYQKYPGVRQYYDTLLDQARTDGYVETLWGRRRYIPKINDANKTMRSMAEREALNMPIQGTAADIIKIAMIELDANIRNKGLEGNMILQVHDELVFDVPQDEVGIFEVMVTETMESILQQQIPDDKKTLYPIVPPILVEVGVGDNWSTAK